MDYDLTDEQQALVDGLQAVLRPHENPSATERLQYRCYRPALQQALQAAGFLDVAANGLGTLEAGLVAITAANSPCVAEVANSALIWPAVQARAPDGPVAYVGDPAKPARFLSVARHALVDTGADLVAIDLADGDALPVETILAYPYAKLADPQSVLHRGRSLGGAARLLARRWGRIALALEFAGAAERAVAFTVEYVKQRHAFGRPIGSFQAVQHRLAQCHQIARGLRYASLYAAFAGTDAAACIAANLAQRHAGKLAFDLHQFNGGMGVTNEHSLHLWTHRLRALQGELGGAHGAALELAGALWPATLMQAPQVLHKAAAENKQDAMVAN